MDAATTERGARPRRGHAGHGPRRAAAAGPDRATVVLLTLAAFLAVLALLAWQLDAGAGGHRRPVTVLRRVYQTTVVESVLGGSGGSSVTQSTSSTAGSYGSAAQPTTRSS